MSKAPYPKQWEDYIRGLAYALDPADSFLPVLTSERGKEVERVDELARASTSSVVYIDDVEAGRKFGGGVGLTRKNLESYVLAVEGVRSVRTYDEVIRNTVLVAVIVDAGYPLDWVRAEVEEVLERGRPRGVQFEVRMLDGTELTLPPTDTPVEEDQLLKRVRAKVLELFPEK